MFQSPDQLNILEMNNYIAPGFSYDKYLKACGCEVTKGHFPYEYMECLKKLDDTTLPPKVAFFSQLKDEGISDEDYASCEEAWRYDDFARLGTTTGMWYRSCRPSTDNSFSMNNEGSTCSSKDHRTLSDFALPV